MFAVAVAAFDKVIGLDIPDIPVDSCITKAPCGGEAVGPSSLDRCKRISNVPRRPMRLVFR